MPQQMPRENVTLSKIQRIDYLIIRTTTKFTLLFLTRYPPGLSHSVPPPLLLWSLCSLLPVLQGGVRHHRPLRPQDGQHAHVLLWRPARLLRHAVLPHRDGQPVRHPAEARAAGRPSGRDRPLQLDQVRLHVQLRFR